MITEPDVALTDYAIAVECTVFVWLLHRGGDPEQPLRRSLMFVFGAISAASLAGGTAHGFFLGPTSTRARVLWPATLIAIGGVTLAAWGLWRWRQALD